MIRFPARLFAALGACVLAACASQEPAWPVLSGMDSNLEPDWSWAELGPTDVLRVTVWGHPEASTKGEGERIDQTGTVSLPLVGQLQVGGLTVDQARGEITQRLARYIREPKVALTILEYGAREFYLLGQIEEPGPKKLDRHLSALQALSYGGRILRGAEREEILLFRRSGDSYEVHKFSADEPGSDGLVAIQTNDLVYVPRSGTGAFYEEVLPWLQGAGFLAAVPVGIAALR